MHCSQKGLKLIASFEGFVPRAIWDRWGKCWTVGYGQTQGVGQGATMTRAQAEADLQKRLARDYEPAINALGALNQNQYDALCSFVWNLGPASMRWDVGNFVRQRKFRDAADAMLKYNRAGGQVLAGLTKRRKAEHDLFLSTAGLGPRVLKFGMRGKDVEQMQIWLVRSGALKKAKKGQPPTIDGHFGRSTHGGLVLFQKEHKLKPDGVAGPQTLGLLKKNYGAPWPKK